MKQRTESGIWEVKYLEIPHESTKRKKIKNEESLTDLRDNMKHNSHIIEVQKKRENKNLKTYLQK